MLDIESDGGLLGENSMVCFGAVIVEDGLERTFYGKLKPISDTYNQDALAVSGFTREEHESFDDPKLVMLKFKNWLKENIQGRPVLVSDNNGYDASWINWYFLKYLGENPFGYSSRRLADIICGFEKDAYFKWKHLRDTKHTHHPVDDAKGNAEVLLKYQKKGFKIRL